MKVLLADDEIPLLSFLFRGLQAEGFECYKTNVLQDVITLIKKVKPQVVVLDRMFEEQDSVEIVPLIKHLPDPPMVLLLTAVDEVSERVSGLQKGADDYLCKPFDFDELLARITVLGRRIDVGHNKAINEISFANITLDKESRIASVQGIELQLTKLEYDLCLYFIENPNKVLSRERILSRVWQTYSDPQTNIVDVYVSRLRQKLPSNSDIEIQTLRGNGYRLINAS
ncbi:response regulator transcription factor [Glaciecola sp. 1036]|uniref:response regulator transcription factor n=1 Tax=Alteromonadaceae TaxID=72275 RepID=UPI003D00DE03